MPRGKKASNAEGSPRRKRARKGEDLAPPPSDPPADAPAAEPCEAPQPRKRRRPDPTPNVVLEASDAAASEAVPTEPEAPAGTALEAATDPAVEQDPALAKAEADLARRYPDHRIKPGSLRPAGADPAFGGKRTVAIVCDCGAERTLATSDLFHVRACVACSRQARKARKRGAK